MTPDIETTESRWRVYILSCADGTLYTGATTNLDRRLRAHLRGVASKYTRCRRPVLLLAVSEPMNRSLALRLEKQIKKIPKARKVSMLAALSGPSDID